MDNVREEFHVVSAMIQRLATDARLIGALGRSALSSKAKTDGEGETPSKSSGNRR